MHLCSTCIISPHHITNSPSIHDLVNKLNIFKTMFYEEFNCRNICNLCGWVYMLIKLMDS